MIQINQIYNCSAYNNSGNKVAILFQKKFLFSNS